MINIFLEFIYHLLDKYLNLFGGHLDWTVKLFGDHLDWTVNKNQKFSRTNKYDFIPNNTCWNTISVRFESTAETTGETTAE